MWSRSILKLMYICYGAFKADAKRLDEACKISTKREQQINFKSPDTASQGSKSKKRTGQ